MQKPNSRADVRATETAMGKEDVIFPRLLLVRRVGVVKAAHTRSADERQRTNLLHCRDCAIAHGIFPLNRIPAGSKMRRIL